MKKDNHQCISKIYFLLLRSQTYKNTSLFLVNGRKRRERLLLANDDLLVLVRDVALDLALEDEVGQDALGLVAVHVVRAHLAEGHQEGVDRHLVGLEQQVDLLEQVSGNCGITINL